MWRAFAPTTSRLPGPVASASLSLLRPFSDIASYKFRPKHVSVKCMDEEGRFVMEPSQAVELLNKKVNNLNMVHEMKFKSPRFGSNRAVHEPPTVLRQRLGFCRKRRMRREYLLMTVRAALYSRRFDRGDEDGTKQ